MKLLTKLKGIMHQRTPHPETYLIVGLGNPGKKYERNRHNVGFLCIDHIANKHSIPVGRKRFKAYMGEGRIAGNRVVLAKPLTFMNESGLSVSRIRDWYKVDPQHIIVMYDDLDLPVGRVRVRPGGGAGGHRGVRSIIEQLGTDGFCRVRVGIGRPVHGDPIDYVLGDPDPDQQIVMRNVYPLAEEIVVSVLEDGIRETMNAFNGRELVS